jgi:hypothetical protein
MRIAPKRLVALRRGITPLFVWALGLVSGCASSHEEFVQVRAADDFECVADGIDVEEVGRSRYVARGCGKQGEYVCSATPDGVDCSQSTELDVESPSTLAPPPSAEPSATTTTP